MHSVSTFDQLAALLGNLALCNEQVAELLVRRRLELGRGPLIRRQIRIRLGNGVVRRHGEVAQRTGLATRRRVHVPEAGVRQDLLRDSGGDNAGTTRSGNETHPDGAALASNLARDGVHVTERRAPVTAADRDDSELGSDDRAANRGSNLLGALNAKPDVAVVVTDDDDGLEARTLTGAGLLLDRDDLHDLVLQLIAEELFNDLVLLDGQRESVDLLERFDLVGHDQSAELRNGDPLVLITTPSTATTSTTTAATLTAPAAETTAETAALTAFTASRGPTEIAHPV